MSKGLVGCKRRSATGACNNNNKLLMYKQAHTCSPTKRLPTGSTMTNRNSGISRLLLKNMDQIEVNLVASSSMEKNNRMELNTPTTNLKRLIAEKAAIKENKKTKS